MSEISKIRGQLKENVLNNNTFIGYEKEREHVYSLLKRTVEVGESNSALLIGPRGAGKTTLVNDVLTELEQQSQFRTNGVVVRLHGLIHTDDRLALISTTSQMNLDNAVDGKVFGSFAENLAFLLACLRTGNKQTSKSIIFIIEDFDLFCSHHNQTLLYNLFDISQSAQAPICVLGITCRLDVIELLEKRVKSRFSHRQYFLFPGQDEQSEVSDLDHRISRVNKLLSVHTAKGLNAASVKRWNEHVGQVLGNKKLRTLMQRLLDIDLSETTLKNIILIIITSLNENKTTLSMNDFEDSIKQFEKDEIVEQLQDLSVLELCLLISMKHHIEIYEGSPMNFEMIFTRYMKFANSSSNVQTVQRPVVMKAFEHIQSMDLIQTIGGTSGRLQKEYQMFNLLVTPQQIMEGIKKWHGLPTEVSQWAISSII